MNLRIWDKVAVGAYKILVFVAVVIITTLKRLLMRCDNVDAVLDAITHVSFTLKLFSFLTKNERKKKQFPQINEETSDVIVSKAIELWQLGGSSLGTMSPNTISLPLNT